MALALPLSRRLLRAKNRRRMAVFDEDMLKPSFLPQLAETALAALRLWSFGFGRRTAA
jgi:hypothetical protein